MGVGQGRLFIDVGGVVLLSLSGKFSIQRVALGDRIQTLGSQ